MKVRNLLPLAALALPLCLSAKPAYRGVLSQVNPDGTTVEFRLHGDEHFSYLTDLDGMLLRKTADGALVRELADGQPVLATQEIVDNMYQAALDADVNGLMRAPQRMAALDSDGRTTYPTKGETRSLVVLVEFSDVRFQPTSPQDINDMLNKEGYSKFGSNGSARDYYVFNSNGQYAPVFDVSRVVTLPNTAKYYTGDSSSSKYDRWREAIKYALDELNSEIDYSKYDYDNDGIVDTVYFFYAGYGQADTPLQGQVIWPHQSSLAYFGYYYDGVQMGPYACSNELNGQMHYYDNDKYLDGPGTFVHEFGHVLGMPDLYSPAYAGTEVTPGDWDIMDGGSYNNEGYCPPALSAYEKWMYKWIEYTPAADNTHYDLKPVQQGGQAIRVPVVRTNGKPYDTEYFILESRDKKNWDAYLRDNGMLVWHLQYSSSIWTSNKVNVTAGHPRCYLVSADGTANPFLGTIGNPINAAFPGTKVGLTYIYPQAEINLQAYASNTAANPLDVFITSIGFDPETSVTSFDYNVVREEPSEIVNIHEPLRTANANGDPTAGFVVEWDPVEGADSYMVTIYRYTSSGKQSFESGYNEKNVGNVTSVEIKNLTTAKMGLEYHAYVRCVKGVPSKNHSSEIVFTPQNVTDVVGVESIGADNEAAPVYGVNGGIVAPEGAEIYNLTGVRVANENLAPGIYIVRLGNRVQKVTVR